MNCVLLVAQFGMPYPCLHCFLATLVCIVFLFHFFFFTPIIWHSPIWPFLNVTIISISFLIFDTFQFFECQIYVSSLAFFLCCWQIIVSILIAKCINYLPLALLLPPLLSHLPGRKSCQDPVGSYRILNFIGSYTGSWQDPSRI